MKSNIVIVGGGLTGILCALRLSLNDNKENMTITLIDSNETLGGRFFFSNFTGGLKSGFGFEIQPTDDLETLKRHLFLYLTEEEKTYLDHFTQERIEKYHHSALTPKKYFIKKNFLDSEYLLLTNSEFLTKKEAECLYTITNFQKTEHFENEQETTLEHSNLWKNTERNTQENVLSILECTIGKYALKLPLKEICLLLQNIFYRPQNHPDPFFFRTSEIELAFQNILQKRNVNILTQCTVGSVNKKDNEYCLGLDYSFSNSFETQLQDRPSLMVCDKLVFTIPPYNMRTLIQKEDFSNELACFISKVQPTSFVCLEIHEFQDKLLDSMQNTFNTLDTLYFPVEGVSALITSNGCLHFFTELDYETSLQTPSVREALTRLRRAVRRILRSEFVEDLKKGSFIRKTENFERIILSPIAKNLPNHVQTIYLPELKDTTFQLDNVYAAGDYFYSLGDNLWKRIVKSVEQCVTNLVHHEYE